MRLSMWVERSDLEIRKGNPEMMAFDLGDGRQRRAMSCRVCDTRLWALPTSKPDLAMLFSGTLHNARDFEPVAHLWMRSAPSWITLPADAVSYETQPEQPGELARLWQEAIGGKAQT
jgi:hypothetical protein